MLSIGRIRYANCTPIFEALQNHFSCLEYEFVKGVPTALNTMLREEKLHVCPSSSIEYALHPDKYLILPNLSISSNGAVKSVLLFSKKPIETLDNSIINLSTESDTSVNLLKILLKQRFGFNCTFLRDSHKQSQPYNNDQALLLIGDAALKASMTLTNCYIYDLGELWKEWTGFPFVFALWICTVASIENHWHELCSLNENLQQAKQHIVNEYEKTATASPDVEWMGKERLIDYWQNNINYDLSIEAQQGLQLFYKKSFQLGLIPKIPELKFLSNCYKTERMTVKP